MTRRRFWRGLVRPLIRIFLAEGVIMEAVIERGTNVFSDVWTRPKVTEGVR